MSVCSHHSGMRTSSCRYCVTESLESKVASARHKAERLEARVAELEGP